MQSLRWSDALLQPERLCSQLNDPCYNPNNWYVHAEPNAGNGSQAGGKPIAVASLCTEGLKAALKGQTCITGPNLHFSVKPAFTGPNLHQKAKHCITGPNSALLGQTCTRRPNPALEGQILHFTAKPALAHAQ